MQRTERIQIDYHDDVDAAVERFGDHEGMGRPRVLRWLEQFSDDDLPLAVQIIRSTNYYDATNIRSITRQLFQILVEELTQEGHSKIVFVAVGDAGSGSSTVARILRQLVRNTNFRLLSMVDLSRLEPADVDAIVFVDDFSGTGLTLEKWWENVEALVRPKEAAVIVGLLVLNYQARERIEQFAQVLAVNELRKSDNVFLEESQAFSVTEKDRLLRNCRRTGCGPKFERGFGECGLLLAFKHGCPNNSIPVLWYDNQNWRPLFNRRAI